jgi:phosphoribosyl 1,2-cyclic phosphodiesterase
MSVLYVLGSGSAGNALAMHHAGATLLIDAGFSAREILRRAATVGLSLGDVAGLLLTHEHGDHTSGAPQLAKDLGVAVVATTGTWHRLRDRMGATRHLPLPVLGRLTVGPFTIESAPTSHDAAEPVAVAVSVTGGPRVGIAYDLGRPTAAVRYLLTGLDALVLEANHDEVMLRTSSYPAAVRHRILGSGGHLSNRAAADLVSELAHPGLGLVVLAHLSERCNTEREARTAVAAALEAAELACELRVARQDVPMGPLLIRSACRDRPESEWNRASAMEAPPGSG